MHRIKYLLLLISFLFLFSACRERSDSMNRMESIFTIPQDNLTGLEFSSNEILEQMGISIPGFLGKGSKKLPIRYDLSHKMPPVKAQGRQPSCVAWALAYACRSYYNLKLGEFDFVSDSAEAYQRCASPSFVFNSLNKGKLKPLKMVDALEFLRLQGSCSINRMNYKEDDWRSNPNEDMKLHANAYRIESYMRLPLKNPVAEIKAQLLKDNPILVGAYYDREYFENGYGKKDAEYLWDTIIESSKAFGHAIVITGYDDEKEQLKFMNSWGDRWGSKGYGYMSYKIVNKAIREAYIIRPYKDHEIYSNSGDGWDEHPSARFIGDTIVVIPQSNGKVREYANTWYVIDTLPNGKKQLYQYYDTTYFKPNTKEWHDYRQSSLWQLVVSNRNGKIITSRQEFNAPEPAYDYNRSKDEILSRVGLGISPKEASTYGLKLALSAELDSSLHNGKSILSSNPSSALHLTAEISLPDFLLLTEQEGQFAPVYLYIQLYEMSPAGLVALGAGSDYQNTEGNFMVGEQLNVDEDLLWNPDNQVISNSLEIDIPLKAFSYSANSNKGKRQLVAIPCIVIDDYALRYGEELHFSL